MFNLKQFFMQKKNLFASAILMLCTLFVFTGCKEVMSSLDNPVDSYFKLTETSTKIYRGQSYQIKFTAISDAKPIFKSSDEKIALVDENGVVTGANRGTAKISVELPATDYYNGASAEFTVEVDALLNLPLDAKELALNEEYNLGVTSVSTGAITYKSSDTKVATVDADGNVTAKGYGDATITISIAATPEYDRTETAEFAAKVRVFDFASLKAYCTSPSVEEPYVILADNASIVFNSDLNVNGKKYVTIKGNKKKPAKLSFSASKSIVIDGGFTLAYVDIDATGSSHIIKGYKETTKEKVSDYIIVKEPVLIEGVMVKNLQKAFFYDNDAPFFFEKFTINDCLVSLKKEGNVTINFNKSMAGVFTLSNSTFSVSDTSGEKNFIALNGSKRPWQVTGYAGESKLVCDHNTFYNVAKVKQFLNSNSLKGQSQYTYHMSSNIFVDSFNKKIYEKMTNDKATQVVDDGLNTYWYNNETFSETKYKNAKEGLKTNPNFKDAANGIFVPQGADQVANQTGDPRWYEAN